mmetsp:Transcript_49153/g.59300  ORF Transcript_49153/g.59300 Transcript_49153/m.59300 type:complete len:86 (+) Transcript_49153:174-431(+)
MDLLLTSVSLAVYLQPARGPRRGEGSFLEYLETDMARNTLRASLCSALSLGRSGLLSVVLMKRWRWWHLRSLWVLDLVYKFAYNP